MYEVEGAIVGAYPSTSSLRFQGEEDWLEEGAVCSIRRFTNNKSFMGDQCTSPPVGIGGIHSAKGLV